MRLPLSALAAAAVAALIGCSTSNGDTRTDEPEVNVPNRKGAGADEGGETGSACTPKTCAQLGTTCGEQDDGCGGTVSCGACDASCTPKTCQELDKACGKHPDGCGGLVDCGADCGSCTPKTCAQLGKTCGNHSDGCNGTVSCGACPTPCTADAKEKNDTPQTATDLGAATDTPETAKAVYELTLPDGDEDWFKLAVTDAGFNGNPRISASVPRVVEVSVFFVCKSSTNYSTCPNAADTPDTTIGKGCRGRSNAMLQTDCSGIDESGTAYVRVRKLANDGLCGGYSLDVHVD